MIPYLSLRFRSAPAGQTYGGEESETKLPLN